VKNIFITVTNDLETDQRMHKTAVNLNRNGYQVKLIGRRLKQSSSIRRPYSVKRFRFLINRGFCFYACYNLRLFFYLLVQKWDIVLSCDMDSLPAGFLAARLRKRNVVFDSHELFSEVPEVVDRPFVQSVWRKLEGLFIPRINHAYTVSQSIADYYKNRYETDFHVIRNLPSENRKMTSDVKVSKRHFVLYQGALNPYRGIDEIIEAMHYLPQLDLVIAGSGPLQEELIEKRNNLKYKNAIHFTGHLNFEKLASLTSQAWLGVSLEADKGLNYRYALPNKLFDYMQAGVPVLISNLPEMSRFVDETGIGWKISSDATPEALANGINSIWDDVESYRRCEHNANQAAKKYTWEQEALKQLEIFRAV